MVNDPLGGEPVAVVATGIAAGRSPADAGGRVGRAIRRKARAAMTGRAAASRGIRPAAAQRRRPPPRPAPRPSPSSTARPASARRCRSRRRATRARRSSSACSKARATARSRGSRPTAHGRPKSMPAPVKPLPASKDGPRIAIVVGGLGVGANVTQQAIAKLPGPVTFAFAPYGADVERLATRARAEGHEVLLQVPMEPFDYPDNDPGPQTLLTSLDAEQNIDRLHWLMSRFRAMSASPITWARASPRPSRRCAGAEGDRQARADLCRRRLLAAQPRRPDRRRQQPAVRQGRDRARRGADAGADRQGAGAARGAGARARHARSASPPRCRSSIERIAQWAKAAESRGIVLVPITAVAIKPKSIVVGIATRKSRTDNSHTVLDSIRTEAMDSGTRAYRVLDRNDGASNAPLRRPALSPLRRPVRDQPQGPACSSAGAPTAPSTSTRPTSGRCRRAASTRARSLIRRRCASSTRRPTSSRWRSSARSRTG